MYRDCNSSKENEKGSEMVKRYKKTQDKIYAIIIFVIQYQAQIAGYNNPEVFLILYEIIA